MIKLTKKIKDEFKKIPNIPVTNDKEPIPFSEFIARDKEEREAGVVDFSKLKGFLTKEV